MRPSASGGHRARDSLAGGCELVAVTVTQAVNCEARAKSLPGGFKDRFASEP